jgi:hypothetical protein
MVIVSNLPFGSGCRGQHVLTDSPDPRQHPFGSEHHAPIRSVIRGPLTEESASSSSVSRCLSATGLRFSGRPSPAGASVILTNDLPEEISFWTPTGLSRSTSNRYDRVGCPLYPGDGDALPPDKAPPGGTRRLPAAGPYLSLEHPIGESANDEASTRVQVLHPSGLSQPVTPGWNEGPWA